ncbi:MAG: tyrosine-type recombinase/integrase [Melioribacteraceae bacterium]
METKSQIPSDFSKLSPKELNMYIKIFEDLVPQLKKLKDKKSLPENSIKKFSVEYLEHLKISYSESYFKSVERSLNELMNYFGEEKSISEIKRSDLNSFVEKMRSHAPKGYRNYFRNLKAAFNFATSYDYIEVNPFAKFKLPKTQKLTPAYYNVDQLNLIIDKMNNDILKDIVQFAFFTGCRRIEILNLRWRNIDFNKKLVTVGDEAYTTKTKTQRFVPMSDKVYNLLWQKSKEGVLPTSEPDLFVFSKAGGFRFHIDTLTKAFKRACRLAGIKEEIHFHSSRHSFASHLVQKKIDVYNVRDLLGHASIKTTEIYAHLNIDSLKESISVLN